MPQQTSILAELNQPPRSKAAKKSSALFTVVITILAFALSLAFIFVTKNFLNDKIKAKIFNKNPLSTLDNSVNILAEIGFYAALYMVSLTFTVMVIRIFSHSVNPAIMDRLEPAEKTNELIRGFTQALIMFGCLFLYFLENSKKSSKTEPGFFLPFWFLSGYASMWVGNLFEIIFKRDIGFTKLGQFVVVWTFAVLLAEIGGFKVFKMI